LAQKTVSRANANSARQQSQTLVNTGLQPLRNPQIALRDLCQYANIALHY